MKVCTKCKETKPLDDFGRDKRCRDGIKPRCTLCSNAYMRDWRERNPARAAATVNAYRARNPEAVKRRTAVLNQRNRLRQYGLSLTDFDNLMLRQSGVCLICWMPGELVIDHCHQTGEVRGLLCRTCNLGSSLLSTAIDYLAFK